MAPKVIDLSTRRPLDAVEAAKRIGRESRRRGHTVRDLSFLSRVYGEGLDMEPLAPARGEKAAAERLRRGGFLWRRRGDEDAGYLLTTDGEKLLEELIAAMEAFEPEPEPES